MSTFDVFGWIFSRAKCFGTLTCRDPSLGRIRSCETAEVLLHTGSDRYITYSNGEIARKQHRRRMKL
jgi:hypothetical protein